MNPKAASPPLSVTTDQAPPPAGPYSQAMQVGDLLFIAGQTPRRPDGERLLGLPLREQAVAVMENLEAIARASGSSLVHAVKLSVFLAPGVDVQEFNAVYERYVRAPLPARTATISGLTTGLVEVDAVVWVPPRQANLVAS